MFQYIMISSYFYCKNYGLINETESFTSWNYIVSQNNNLIQFIRSVNPQWRVLLRLCFRKNHTSVHNAPSRSQRREILRVICTCIMGYGHLGAIFVAVVSVNRPILKTTCYYILADVRTRRLSNPFLTTDQPVTPPRQFRKIYRELYTYFVTLYEIEIKIIPLNISPIYITV